MPTCRVCKRDYVYDNERGYHRNLCSDLCDGIERGMERSKTEIERLRTLLASACDDWETSITRDDIQWKPEDQIAFFRANIDPSQAADPLVEIANGNSTDPVLANFEQAVRDGISAASGR